MIRFSQFLLDAIPPLNVIEPHLCDIAVFIISDNVLFTRFLSHVDWVSGKAIIIAALVKHNGAYLMFIFSMFRKLHSWRTEKQQKKLHEVTRNRTLNQKDHKILLSLNQENKSGFTNG